MSFLRTSLAVLAFGLALLVAVRVEAAPLRALVRLAEPHDRTLLERLRGQTSDLDVQLATASTDPLEPGYAEQLRAMRTLAEERGARVAIWVARRDERMVVYVVDLGADRVFARALARSDDARDASALDEAAALVVRSALRASLAGAAFETPEPERVAEVVAPPAEPEPAPPPAPPPPAPVVAPKTTSAAQAVAPRSRRIDVWVGAGGQAAFDGLARAGRYALAARALITFGRLEAGVAGAFGFAVTRTTEVAELSLAQHRAHAFFGVALLTRETVRLALDASVGLHVATTKVTRPDPAFAADERRTLLLALGAELRLAYAPRWARSRLALGPSIGMIALPERLVLGYYDETGFVRVRRLYAVQPVVGLELAVRF